MQGEKIRHVDVWSPEIEWEERADGTILVKRSDPLPPYPHHISERLFHWAKTEPNRVWMAERGADGAWQNITYGALGNSVKSIAQGLINLGLNTETPIVILSGNSLKHALLVLGAQHIGIPTAAISPAYSLADGGFEKLHSIVAQLSPGLVFIEDSEPFAAALQSVIPDGIPVICGQGRESAQKPLDWATLVNTIASSDVDRIHQTTGPDTVAKFLFTSGTTGSPKAVIQTQRMLCANQEQVQNCFSFMKTEPPVFVDWAPWNHTASGNKVFYMTVYNGGTYYIDAGKPTPTGMAETIRNLREISPTWYFNVPAGYEMLLEAMETDTALKQNFFRDVNMLMYAGAGLAGHLWEQLKSVARETLGHEILLTTGLGSTETGPFALYCTIPQKNPGNIGVPAQGVEMKLVPVAGKLEIRVKGPNITPGYWNDAKNTGEAFDEEGFYRMGDALRYAVPGDPSQGFYFDGRIAENFKLATGTWVAVGAVRAELNDALAGFTRDVVISGEGRNALGALLIPFRPAIERLVPNGADLNDTELLRHPVLVEKIQTLLSDYGAKITGSSRRVARVMFLETPLAFRNGEVTEKGSVNQRAVLRNFAREVETIYTDDPRVITVK